MTEVAICPDCKRPSALEMPEAISTKGPCARQWHPVAADDCIGLTVIRLRQELATLQSKLDAALSPGEGLSGAERAVVEAAMAWAGGGTTDGPLEHAIRRLGRVRAKAGR